MDVLKCIAFLVIILTSVNGVTSRAAIKALNVDDISDDGGRAFCMLHSSLQPPSYEHQPTKNFFDWTAGSFNALCSDPESPVSANGSTVVVREGNCTFSEQALRAQELGSSAVIIITNSDEAMTPANQWSGLSEINITVATMSESVFRSMKKLGERLSVRISAHEPTIVGKLNKYVLTFLIAVFTVVPCSSIVGRISYRSWCAKFEIVSPDSKENTAGMFMNYELPEPIIVSIIFPICLGLVWITLLCFYDLETSAKIICSLSLLTIWIGIEGITWCISDYTPYAAPRIPKNDLPFLRFRPEKRELSLFVSFIVVSVLFIALRSYSFGFIFGDILGVCLCLWCIIRLKTPNFKLFFACFVIFPILMFLIIFMFWSFTIKDLWFMESYHTKTATLTLPKYIGADFCDRSVFSHLDMIIPGIMLSFLRFFDLQRITYGIYFRSTSIAYGVGLIASFIVAEVIGEPQMIMLYTAPCMLTTMFIIGLLRGEMCLLWHGVPEFQDYHWTRTILKASAIVTHSKRVNEYLSKLGSKLMWVLTPRTLCSSGLATVETKLTEHLVELIDYKESKLTELTEYQETKLTELEKYQGTKLTELEEYHETKL